MNEPKYKLGDIVWFLVGDILNYAEIVGVKFPSEETHWPEGREDLKPPIRYLLLADDRRLCYGIEKPHPSGWYGDCKIIFPDKRSLFESL